MYRRHTVARLTGLSILAIACQSGDSPAGGSATFVVEDSAGIEIVESAVPAWEGGGWTVATEPSVSIGRTSGDERYLFGSVRGAVVLTDARIAVLDEQAALVRVYSPEGVHLEDWGGRGEGPGEFNFPVSLFPYRGDSILVRELITMGLSVFDDRGRFGRRTIPPIRAEFVSGLFDLLTEGSVIPADSCCRFWGPLSSGAFLVSYPEMIPTTGRGMHRSSVSVAIIPDSGGAAAGVGEFRGGRYLPGPTRASVPTTFQFPLWFNMAAGQDGYFVTEGDAYSISEYDATGRLRRSIRLARGPRPVTDEVKAEHEAWLRERVLAPGAPIEGDSPEQVLQRRLDEPYPATLPSFFQLHVDPDGNLWAVQRRYGAGDDGRLSGMLDYFVFGPDGRHLGVIALPDNLQVYQIGRDYILGVLRDELEVQFVHLYEIEKGGRS